MSIDILLYQEFTKNEEKALEFLLAMERKLIRLLPKKYRHLALTERRTIVDFKTKLVRIRELSPEIITTSFSPDIFVFTDDRIAGVTYSKFFYFDNNFLTVKQPQGKELEGEVFSPKNLQSFTNDNRLIGYNSIHVKSAIEAFKHCSFYVNKLGYLVIRKNEVAIIVSPRELIADSPSTFLIISTVSHNKTILSFLFLFFRFLRFLKSLDFFINTF